MRIIVLSDTHGNPKVLETILARHADADACIHLGDGEGMSNYFYPVIQNGNPSSMQYGETVTLTAAYPSAAPLT